MRVKVKGDHVEGFFGSHQSDLMKQLGHCLPALAHYFGLQLAMRDSPAWFEHVHMLLDHLQTSPTSQYILTSQTTKLTVGEYNGTIFHPPFTFVPSSGTSNVNLSSSNSHG